MPKVLEVRTRIKTTNGVVIETLTDIELDYVTGEDMDVELELVHNGTDTIVRPKNAPKY